MIEVIEVIITSKSSCWCGEACRIAFLSGFLKFLPLPQPMHSLEDSALFCANIPSGFPLDLENLENLEK